MLQAVSPAAFSLGFRVLIVRGNVTIHKQGVEFMLFPVQITQKTVDCETLTFRAKALRREVSSIDSECAFILVNIKAIT